MNTLIINIVLGILAILIAVLGVFGLTGTAPLVRNKALNAVLFPTVVIVWMAVVLLLASPPLGALSKMLR